MEHNMEHHTTHAEMGRAFHDAHLRLLNKTYPETLTKDERDRVLALGDPVQDPLPGLEDYR